MAKIKATAKAIKNSYYNIITVGYCDLQYLLSYFQPAYYTAGVYGWNCDVYIIDTNTVIATGYRPMAGNMHDYEITRKYNRLAEAEIYRNRDIDYSTKKNRASKMLSNYVNEMFAARKL